jgi:hypothetical protein
MEYDTEIVNAEKQDTVKRCMYINKIETIQGLVQLLK